MDIALFASKIGSQRHLSAIRDGFVTLMPLLIVGSLVTLINNIPIGTGEGDMLKVWLSDNSFLSWIVSLNGNVWWGTFGALAVFSVATISYYLAVSYKADGIAAAMISLSAYFCSIPQFAQIGEEVGWGFIHYNYLNAQGLFIGIIVALVSTEIFVKLSKVDKLIIKMPEGVPPAVAKSFAALFPGMFAVLAVTLIQLFISMAFKSNTFDLVSKFILGPLGDSSGSYGFGLVTVLMIHLLWVFGIHGPNIFEGILQPLNSIAITANQEYMSTGQGAFMIFNKSFVDAFVYMGGSGLGLGLVIAILLVSKSKQNRTVARLGFAPGVFNINEPVLFGLPIVLNLVLAIPFVIVPVVTLSIAYFATKIGFLPLAQAVIPWTTPPILSGLFVTNWAWQGPVIQIINLVVGILMYLPFVKIADRIEEKKERGQLQES